MTTGPAAQRVCQRQPVFARVIMNVDNYKYGQHNIPTMMRTCVAFKEDVGGTIVAMLLTISINMCISET